MIKQTWEWLCELTILLFIIIIFTQACINDPIALDSKYSDRSFLEDIGKLLDNRQIDSFTYYKGVILQNEIRSNISLERQSMGKVIEKITHSSELNGSVDFDEIIEQNLDVLIRKVIDNSDSITFKIDVQLNNQDLFKSGDYIYLHIKHENLRGEIYSETYMCVNIRFRIS